MWKIGLRGIPKSEVMISDQELREPRPLSQQGRGGGQRVEKHERGVEDDLVTCSPEQSGLEWTRKEEDRRFVAADS